MFQKTTFWFATGGAGFCLSRALVLKMAPISGYDIIVYINTCVCVENLKPTGAELVVTLKFSDTILRAEYYEKFCKILSKDLKS